MFGYLIGTGLFMVLVVASPGRWSIVERLPVLAVGLIFFFMKAPIAYRRKRRRQDSAP